MLRDGNRSSLLALRRRRRRRRFNQRSEVKSVSLAFSHCGGGRKKRNCESAREKRSAGNLHDIANTTGPFLLLHRRPLCACRPRSATSHLAFSLLCAEFNWYTMYVLRLQHHRRHQETRERRRYGTACVYGAHEIQINALKSPLAVTCSTVQTDGMRARPF